MLCVLFLAEAVRLPSPPQFSHASRACAPSATAAAPAAPAASKLMPPRDREDMLQQAAACVRAARADGINRYTLRCFLDRENVLTPPDESWTGGIMQLYARASPLVKDLLRSLSTDVAGVPPKLSEQRLDESGVDGASVWMAQSSQPQNDAVGFCQPSTEEVKAISKLSEQAGSRPVLLVNPQWKERDDPLDALSRKEGLAGMLGNFLGGKASTEAELARLDFRDVYTLATYRCRGSLIYLQLAYPNGWTAFYRQGVEDETWKPLIAGVDARPTYQEVEQALQDQGVPFRLTEFDSVV